jgi:recombination protein RecA
VKKRRGRMGRAVEIANAVNSVIGKPVLRLGSDEDFIPIKIPTGSLVVDRITGGGFTLGRHVELYGDENACKSFVLLKTMALSQDRGNLCALIDPEKVFDPGWFSHIGGYPDELLLFQPEEKWTAEDAVGVMMTLGQLMDEEAVEIVGIDSVSAMVTQEEMKKDPREEDRVASQARMMSRALRRITTTNRQTLFIWTNQERMNIGFGAQFNPRTQSGGRALRYYATTRLEFKKAGKVTRDAQVAERGQLKSKKVPWGNWIQVRSEKEKSSKPYGQGMFIFDSDHGRIDQESEIIQLGLEDDIIIRTGNLFHYEDVSGIDHKGTESRFKQLISEDADLRAELVDAITELTVQLSRVSDD